MITNAAIDKFPSGAYMDPKLPYTQTGINVNIRISGELVWALKFALQVTNECLCLGNFQAAFDVVNYKIVPTSKWDKSG